MPSPPRITTGGLPSPRRNYNSGVPLPLKISGAGAFILGITGILLFYSSLPQLSYDPRNEQLMADALDSNSSIRHDNARSDNIDAKTKFTTNFTFPTVEERIEYYMGSWYHKNLPVPTSSDAPLCKGLYVASSKSEIVPQRDTLYSFTDLQHRHLMPGFWQSVYLEDAANILTHVESSSGQKKQGEKYVILKPGDGYSPNAHKPVVAKTRRREEEKELRGEEYHMSIIWPIRLKYHFSAIKEKLHKINQTHWSKKKEMVVWRGACTGYDPVGSTSTGRARLMFVAKHKHNMKNGIDVAFDKRCPFKEKGEININTSFYRRNLSMDMLLKYKYILSLEGNDVSTGLKWMLASNSVVFMPPPTALSFAMESKLVPYVHYVPVKRDGSDLLSQLEWAKKNDEKCKWISEQATAYMESLWLSDQAQKDLIIIKHMMGKMYHEKFNKALAVCHSGCSADEVCSGQSPNRIDDISSVQPRSTIYKSNFQSSYNTEKKSVVTDANEPNNSSTCKKAALILFGVPKYFQYTWKSYMENIVRRNPQISIKVIMHMYSDLHQGQVSLSKRNKEENVTLESPADIWAVLEKEGVPAGLTTSPQSNFDKSELTWLQQSDTSGFWSIAFDSLQNVFRQGNSLRESSLHLLRDQKNHSNDIDVYIFARSDTLLLTPVDIPCSGLSDDEIWVPSWASWLGVNDRFAMAGSDAAKNYANKIVGYKEAVIANRNTIAAKDFQQRHTWENSLLRNSETLLKKWLLENKLNVKQIDEWAKVCRVRGDGRINRLDHPSEIARLLNTTKLRRHKNGNLVDAVYVQAVAEKLFQN